VASFTVQDIFGSTVAFFLFTSVFVFPGYVSGWALNLLAFRERCSIVRFVLAIPLSIAISPILFFLSVRLVSSQFALGILFALSIAFVIILWHTWKWPGSGRSTEMNSSLKRRQRQVLLIAAGWSVFAILFLVDLQSQGRLWLNSVSYDYSTRVQVIQAITRTGAPPINPSYYPGYPEKLTFLYYFWYVLCSLIDKLGGRWVDARTALIASVSWCGLGMMATIAVYLRLRGKGGLKIWNSALLGIGSLAISGLDIFPALFFLFGTRLLFGKFALHLPGDIEHWNEQITTWISSFAWVPHHVAAGIACLVGLMLWQSTRKSSTLQKISAASIAGLGFASAFGLSVWVTVIFAVFWGIWMLSQFFERKQAWLMIISGVVAFLAVLPFLLDMLHTGNSGSGQGFPLGISVRPFRPLDLIIQDLPTWEKSLMFLLALPINYLFELGFFFIVAVFWPLLIRKGKWKSNSYWVAEGLLLLVVVVLVTFVRSTVIGNNDFGWRGWLLGQFVLLIWGVDLLEYFKSKQLNDAVGIFKCQIPLTKLKSIMRILMILGIWTTVLSLAALRFWAVLVDAGITSYADQFSTDTDIGRKTYDGRQAFDYISRNTSEDAIVQFNPRLVLDYPSGLYRQRQAIIAIHTLYGVPYEIYRPLVLEVGRYFASPQEWNTLDEMCRRYKIDILVLRDSDPIWESLDELNMQRRPIFINSHDAVFICGTRD